MIRAYKDYWMGYVDFTGRTSRGGYWFAVLAHILTTFVFSIVLGVFLSAVDAASPYNVADEIPVYLVAFQLLCYLPSLAIIVRRLRDGGCSWANIFWALLPLAGPVILIVKLCKPSVPAGPVYRNTGGTGEDMLGQMRIPAAILLLWITLLVMMNALNGGALMHMNVFWWIYRFSMIALVVFCFIGKRNAGLLVPPGILLLLSVRSVFLSPGVVTLLTLAGWVAVCALVAVAVFGKSVPHAMLRYLPSGLFLVLILYRLVTVIIGKDVYLPSVILSVFVDILMMLAFLALGKSFAQKPSVLPTAYESAGAVTSGIPYTPQARQSVPPVYYGTQNRKTPGVLLVRFSIDKLNHLSGSYGFQSGKLIGQAVPAALLEGMTICDGDSAATLAGREYVCMVSIAADDSSILTEKIVPLLLANREITENGAYPITQVVDRTGEPLVVNGVVQNGTIEGAGGWCARGLMNAWEEAAKKLVQAPASGCPHCGAQLEGTESVCAYCDSQLFESTSSPEQRAEVYTANHTENESDIRVVEIPSAQPVRKTGYGGNIMSMLFSILLIFGGASGQFVLRGTNSSTALVVAGFVFLALDIFSMVRKMSA